MGTIVVGIAYNVTFSPKKLKAHPLNKEIYGEESADQDLVDSIHRLGILESLIVKEDHNKHIILSGHRRWLAAIALNLDRVPCKLVSFSDALEEEEALIEWNRQRKKTPSQMVREGEHLEKIERVRAEKRQLSKLKRGDVVPVPETFPERGKGDSRDIVAKKIGMGSGKTYEKAKAVVEKARTGDEAAQKLVKEMDAGIKTIHSAFKEMKKEEDLEIRREELVEKAAAIKDLPDTIHLNCKDFLKDYLGVPESSVDCIITDPPYVKGWLENYGDFAKAATHCLKPGGFLVSYVGHIHLDKILAQMTPYLNFFWICALRHSGTAKAVHVRSVQCGYKPIVIFQKPPLTKPKRYFNDLLQGMGREKSAHEWQQGEEELRQIFEPFTDPGDTILDPFMGSGTVISMAKRLNRRAIGFDINPENVEIVKGRIS